MHYQVLANKWRPKTFSDLYGQDSVVRYFKQAIKQGQIAQAYLLSGTRGVGKTSLARIIGKAVNCLNFDEEPCLECANCKQILSGDSIDFQEIDGASNNSVENIRAINDNLKYLPVGLKYKIYVIDEVHMLSISAFNALLKSIEEPPEHVIFVFATTEPEKVPDTVKSRCQKLDLRSLNREKLEEYLEHISAKEGIHYEKDYIPSLIAEHGRGSIRDMLSLLEMLKVMGEGTIYESHLEQVLGVIGQDQLNQLVVCLLKGDFEGLKVEIKKFYDGHMDLEWLCRQLIDRFYELAFGDSKAFDQLGLKANNFPKDEVVWIYQVLVKEIDWAIKSMFPLESVEMVLNKIGMRFQLFGKAAPAEQMKKKNDSTVSSAENTIIKEPESTLDPSPVEVEEEVLTKPPELETEAPLPQEVGVVDFKFSWDEFIEFYRENHPIPYSYLERGNIIDFSLDTVKKLLKLKIGFHHTEKVFYDYFQEKPAQEKILEVIKQFSNVDQVQIDWNCLNDDQVEKIQFGSIYQEVVIQNEQTEQDQREEILNDETIIIAQKLFNSTIDKVILHGTRTE
jgi:DNA polymerase-3 subunit gamma/tau